MSITDSKSRWVTQPNPRPDAKVRLFCFPYAGSSAVVTYKYLADNLPEFIEVCPVEFPGRGTRMGEKLIDNIEEILSNISISIDEWLDKPFMFFGHSMGALISYELIFKIYEKYNKLPLKLYVSAHKAPFLERGGPIMHKLEKEQFVSELKQMNGIAKELFEHSELMELMLPIIRNDYAVCENYNYKQKKKLDVPITAFGGTDDKDVKEEHLKEWAKVTTSEFNHFLLEGDHFFIVKEKKKFLNIFSKILVNDISKINN